MKPNLLRVVVDDREKKPWTFEGLDIEVVQGRLRTGDYAVAGLETATAIERKSVDDLVKTLTRSRARFFDEVRRMSGYQFAAIVVESSIGKIELGQYDSMVTAASILGTLASIEVNWKIPVVFGGDRAYSQRYASTLLRHAELRLSGRS